LREAGWDVVEGSKVFKDFPITDGCILSIGRLSAKLRADYIPLVPTFSEDLSQPNLKIDKELIFNLTSAR